MTGSGDVRLVAEAAACIVGAVLLITRLRLHPFLALTAAAIALALLASPDAASGLASMEKGFGSVLAGVGPVIALGLTLGTILSASGGAAALGRGFVRRLPAAWQPWGVLIAAFVIGLPLFFETGVVVLLPVVAAIAAANAVPPRVGDQRLLALSLPALAGLSALHALVPPHPGPLIATHELGASLGRTMAYGVVVAIPSTIIAGPLFARFASRWASATPVTETAVPVQVVPSVARALLVVMLPVALIAVGEFVRSSPDDFLGRDALTVLGLPPVALLVANFVALGLLLPLQRASASGDSLWSNALRPAGSILLSIGAGGAFKQVLVDAGLAPALLRLLDGHVTSPILLGWLMAAAVRLATGSATVATVTAAGLMAAVAPSGAIRPEWIVLAIGAGSIVFSYVNDPGFWLVKGFLGTTTGGTIATWSVLETLLSVTALLTILLASQLLP